jgi:hypothetical protein
MVSHALHLPIVYQDSAIQIIMLITKAFAPQNHVPIMDLQDRILIAIIYNVHKEVTVSQISVIWLKALTFVLTLLALVKLTKSSYKQLYVMDNCAHTILIVFQEFVILLLGALVLVNLARPLHQVVFMSVMEPFVLFNQTVCPLIVLDKLLMDNFKLLLIHTVKLRFVRNQILPLLDVTGSLALKIKTVIVLSVTLKINLMYALILIVILLILMINIGIVMVYFVLKMLTALLVSAT